MTIMFPPTSIRMIESVRAEVNFSGIEDGFVQEKDSASEAFIPAFDGTGV